MHKHRLKKYLSVLLLVVFIIITAFFSLIKITELKREREVLDEEMKRKAQYDRILDSASISPTRFYIDYKKQISTGSPLIFGGSHTPPLEHQDAWNKLKESGATFIRKDYYPERFFNKDITLDDYKNNINGIQEPKNWNQQEINEVAGILKNAKQRGMKTVGIMAYAPTWLTYSNTNFGVPRDWDIYRDIVKKTYRLFRDYSDYTEIWNEPNMNNANLFLNTTNSGLSKQQAYEQIFLHASRAIREVDAEINDGKKIPIGGPVSYTKDDATFLEILLRNPQTAKNLDFVSYHQYELNPTESNEKYLEIMKKYGKENLPVFLTEWSASSKGSQIGDIIPENSGIIYSALMFLNYIDMGIKGANYHTFTEFTNGKKNGIEKNHSFYAWQNGQAKLLPLSRTWRILSKQMGLGMGESRIYGVDSASSKGQMANGKTDNNKIVEVALETVGLGVDEVLNSVGFVNSKNEYGVAIVNPITDGQVAEIEMENTGFKKFARMTVYYANAGNEAKIPVYTGLVKAVKGKVAFNFYLPAESVIGIKFSEEKEWYELF